MNDRLQVDALIVGGGPAGLHAALYLARFRRSVIVVDADTSRLRWIGRSHNYPAALDGIAGTAFLEQLRRQAKQYGARLCQEQVTQCRMERGSFIAATADREIAARSIVLATGTRDRLPAIPRASDAILEGRVGLCPVCHGYEATGDTIAILADSPHCLGEAHFMQLYTRSVVVLDISEQGLPHDCRRQLEMRGIKVLPSTVKSIAIERNGIAFRGRDGEPHRADRLYLALGAAPENDLAGQLGARLTPSGHIETDRFQETSVRGLFAAGDVVEGLNQIVVAQAQGAIAAAHLNARWLQEEL